MYFQSTSERLFFRVNAPAVIIRKYCEYNNTDGPLLNIDFINRIKRKTKGNQIWPKCDGTFLTDVIVRLRVDGLFVLYGWVRILDKKRNSVR